MSYRHAIDRILSIPLSEMLGLHVREKAPHAQDEGSNDSAKELLSIDDDVESNIQVTPVGRVSILHDTDRTLDF
jgi:hypothetical protein